MDAQTKIPLLKKFKLMKKISYFAVLTAICLMVNSPVAMARSAGYDWIVRARALNVKADGNSHVSTLGGHVDVTSDQTPELDFTRFINQNWAAELILATTKHDVSAKGSAAGDKLGIGSVKLLPPTLTLQYHFRPQETFRPYAGAGLNYTFFFNAKSGGAATSVKYQDHLGYALQAGFDYMIDSRFGINFDIKKIFLRTNVQVNNAYTAKVKLDPWLVGLGLSYRF